MGIIQGLKDSFSSWQRKRAIKILTTTDPEKIMAFGERRLIPAFQRAAKKVPGYSRLLKERGIDPRKVRDVESFKKLVPIIDKKDIFLNNEIEDLCVGGNLKEMKTAMSSSGFSGIFSFGINTERNLKDAEKSIDTALEYTFNISNKKTLLINCVPMGVKIPTSLKVAETSVRSDMALAIFKKFAHKFDQTLFVSDPHFLKKLVEDGIEQGINWKSETVHLIIGEDWFSESFRSYLAYLIGADFDNPDKGFVGATMGIAELDLNLFHESIHTIRIRRTAQEDKRLRYALFGEGIEVCPILFHYYPHRTYLEAISQDGGQPELIFSMLSPYMLIPLIRYNSKDVGMVFTYNQVKEILTGYGYGHLCPELKLPMVAVGGRRGRCLTVGNTSVYPEEVKQGLYSDFEVAGAATGYFRLSRKNDNILLEVQLKKGIAVNLKLQEALTKAIASQIKGDVILELRPYNQFQFGMEVDYERKFRHID